MRTCTVSYCSFKHYGVGLCKLHYNRKLAGKGLGTPPCTLCGKQTPRPDAKFCGRKCQMKWYRRHGCYTDEETLKRRGKCSLCEKPVHANGFCRAHDMKRWRHGDPLKPTKHLALICIECGKPTKKGAALDLCAACYIRLYYHKNLKVERARRNARRSRMKLATPPWADMDAIRKFYQACPPGQEVDHALPLKGRRVSGLHVLENLQYLAMSANRRKLNRFAA